MHLQSLIPLKIQCLLMLLFLSACSLDTNVKTFKSTQRPVSDACKHADALKVHPIINDHGDACVFLACKVESDPNYSKYLEYKAYIDTLTGNQKLYSTIIHDASKCANDGTKVDAVVFSIDPSSSGFIDENLNTQPEVSIVRKNGELAKIATPVTLSVHKTQDCSDAAVSASDWFMTSANPVTTIEGKHQYQNLKFYQLGTYYLKAASPNLKSACSLPIAITDNLGVGKKVIFLSPKPSAEALQDRDLTVQPKVGITNASGVVIDVDNVDITLTLHSDDKCLSTQVIPWEAVANPVPSQDGVSQFKGVAIKAGGTFYFRASSGSLIQDCYGPIKVADRLKFSQLPSGVVGKDVILPVQPIVAVAHQDLVIAPFENVSVQLNVYTDAQCSIAAHTDDYEISTNPVTTNSNGLASFAGLKFHKEMKFYLKGESAPLLSTECISIDVGSNAKKVKFVAPLPSTKAIKSTSLIVQPKVGLFDAQDNLLPENGKSVLLTLHSDVACSTSALTSSLVADTNPGTTSGGYFQFSGVQVVTGGVYFLKVSSIGLEPTCYGSLKVAQKLKLEQSATAQVGVPLASQPKVKVSLPDDSVIEIAGVPVEYKVYTDALCKNVASSSQWSMTSQNTVLTNASGVAEFSGVVIHDVGTFYAKATTTASLDASACLPIATTSLAHTLAFGEPYFPAMWEIQKLFDPQPTVEARDSNGNLVSVNIPISLSLHTNSDCSSVPLSMGVGNVWDVNSSPNQTVNGKITFSGFTIFNSGKYYLKAKTSSPGVLPVCSYEIKIADTVLGCTEKLAKNFNPLATKDDCSCVFEFCPIGDKPSPDSVEAAYNNYPYNKKCDIIPDFINTCPGSCEDKKDQAQADKNKTSGYKYKCDQYKKVFDDHCLNLPNDMYCKVLKQTYEACYRTATCSKYGLIDDVAALQELASIIANHAPHHDTISLFNSDDSLINYLSSFDSICFKLRFPGALDNAAIYYPDIKQAYEKYCDCKECEDPGICNHPDAENYNPGSGSGSGTGTPTLVTTCANLSQTALSCVTAPNSAACFAHKAISAYCQSKKSCLSTVVGAGVPVPPCFLNPQSQACASVCETQEAPFWYCSQPHNQGTPYCQDFFQYYGSCVSTGQPPSNYNGVFPGTGCANVTLSSNCPTMCYQNTTGLGQCDEAKKFLELYCSSSVTNAAQLEKCAFYKEYYKFCLGTKFCDMEKAKWPFQDLLSLIAALPTYAVDANTCSVYNMMWSMCSKVVISPTVASVESAVCENFYKHVKSCASGANPPVGFYNLDCSNYQYYLTQCSNQCPDGDNGNESCKFRVCNDPQWSHTLGYKKYLEYVEYCKKQNVKCEFTYDPKLCTGVVGGSLRPLDATFKPIPATEFLQLWLDDVNNQIILFGMSENFLVEAVDGLNEVGPQLIPWSESTHLYFYTDDSCSVPLPDPQCIIAHNPASAQQYADRVKYSGDQSLGPWPCQVTQPNGAKFIMKSFKIKSATKESLCRRVIVKMN